MLNNYFTLNSGRHEIKLISFDAADTLIKLVRSVGEHYSSIASKHGVQASVEDINKSFKKVFAETPPLSESGDKDLQWWKEVIEKTFAALGFQNKSFSNFDNFVKELYDALSEDRAWATFNDVENTLQELKKLGLRMIVFSNFDERLLKVLADLSIDHYFEKVICSSQIGYGKPDTKAFRKVAELVDLKPEEILHVGDGFENDYLGAYRAGFQSLYLNRSGLQLYSPIHEEDEIKDLQELIPVLSKIVNKINS